MALTYHFEGRELLKKPTCTDICNFRSYRCHGDVRLIRSQAESIWALEMSPLGQRSEDMLLVDYHPSVLMGVGWPLEAAPHCVCLLSLDH